MANVAAGRPRRIEFEPIRWPWRLLTSVRFAIALIAFMALAALLGVLIPQIPPPMRNNPVAVDTWLSIQAEPSFGFLTDPMYRLGFFDIFRSLWFVSGLGLLVASVCVCTANRIGPVWRNALHPQTRVPDEYFERGQPIIDVPVPDAEALAQRLRSRRYRVTLTNEGKNTYLFADRFSFAQFATFISHLALILFLAGGFVTLITAREQEVFVGEAEPGAPVFLPTDPDHMQIYVEDAIGEFDESGFPLHFQTDLVVYRGGEEVARGSTTVNHPLRYGGYTFHQTAYFPDGAQLKIREIATGRLIYDEVLALTSDAATPGVVIRDAAGTVLLEDLIIPTDFILDAGGTQVAVPGTDRIFWIGAVPATDQAAWRLIVLDVSGGASPASLGQGETQDFGGLSITFAGIAAVPSLAISNLPGSSGTVVAELSRSQDGSDLFTIGPVDGRALSLREGETAQAAGYEYTFDGRREFSGITVRRDPGSQIIWVATGVFLLGLALTFYLPRRRLWGKITSGEGAFRGLGGRALAIEGEVRKAARAAEAPDASKNNV